MSSPIKDVLRETDDEAVALARRLVRSARYGALATLEPGDGAPHASRVAVATDGDGAPVILISQLSAHRAALDADQRCSLLLGEPGKGDPLAHPRISVACRARQIPRDGQEGTRIRRRYLARHPKAALYADFADFAFFRLEPLKAGLNGGFGRAYALERRHLLLDGPIVDALADAEEGAIAHMNADHQDAVALYARHFARAREGNWRISGIDAEGIDIFEGDETIRVAFALPLMEVGELRRVLVEMAREARNAELDLRTDI